MRSKYTAIDGASALPLIVSAGEPAGIGPDLCLALARCATQQPLVIVADPEQLRRRAALLSQDVEIVEYRRGATTASGALCVLPIELAEKSVCGKPHPDNAAALLDGLRLAVDRCLDGEFAGLVTAPLQKSVINDAGIVFTGHTEFLGERCGVDTPVMLLVADRLRVALVSTHLPLRAVPDYITSDRITRVVEVLRRDLRARFAIDEPEIVVCGLNPHAGEGGHLGDEDDAVIAPAVVALRARGIRVRGPLPADTAFTPAAGYHDAIVAMYHDQGLPVLKYAGFGHAVNVTLGLPIVRTSVDHGTALDIAGSGRADHGSMRAAVELAHRLSAPRLTEK